MGKILDDNRLARIRIIDEALGSKDGVTMDELLSRLEKTGITTNRFCVGRDLQYIGEQMEIEEFREFDKKRKSDRPVKFYRYRSANSSLFKEKISDNEREFLSQALEMLGLKGLQQFKFFRSLKLKADQRNVIISFTKNPDEKSISSNFEKLVERIRRKETVKIGMRDRKPPYKVVMHKVHPWYIREYNRRWYLFGYDEGEGKISHYALDRIAAVRTWEKVYKVPDKSIEEILSDVIGVSLTDEEPKEIVFWVSDESADFVARKLIHHSQKEITEAEAEKMTSCAFPFHGGKYFQIRCKDNYELRRELLSFGPELMVLSPADLQIRLAAQLKRMYDCYANLGISAETRLNIKTEKE